MTKFLSQTGLNVLKVVVEVGTFRAAAVILHISQPAVSAHIHRIEKELEVEIFKRPYGRKLQLTDAGNFVYAYAVEVIAKNIEIEELTKEIRSGEFGQVRFAFSVSKFAVTSLVSAFREQFPKVFFVLRTGNSSYVQKLVLNGEVDFGITLNSDYPNLDFTPFYNEPLAFLCSSNHPLASKRFIDEKDLNQYGIIGGIKGSDYDNSMKNYFSSLGFFSYKIVTEVEDPLIAMKLIEEGGHIGLILLSAAKEALDKGNIVELSFENITQAHHKIFLVFRRGVHYNKATSLFINFLKFQIPKQYPFITLP